MKQKNLAVELLMKLIAEQIAVYRRSDVVKLEKFSEMIQRVMNQYPMVERIEERGLYGEKIA